MTFSPSEIILGATVPMTNGSTITFSVAGHVEGERDYDDAVVIFGRKLLKYTNSATDADRLTVRQVVASITSTPLDKVPDVGTPTSPAPVKEPAKVAPPAPAPKKEAWEPKITKSSYDAMQTAKQDAAPATPPTIAEQVAAIVAQCIKPPATAPDPAPKTAPPEGFGICDKCGEAVPKPQVSRSRTATGRILCIDCMPAPLPTPEPAKPAPQPATTAPAPKPAAPEGEVCEGCGAPVTKSQAKLSQMFMSKTLCKSCMDSNGGA